MEKTEVLDDVLQVDGITLDFITYEKSTRGLNNVSFSVGSEEIIGILGETGSGKSLTLLSIMGLLPHNAHIVGGTIQFGTQDLVGLDDNAYRKLRGQDISIVVQNAKAALNPLARIGDQIMDVYRAKIPLGEPALRARAREVLSDVGFRDIDRVWSAFPHQISGGMAQRVLVAIAIGPSPKLVLFDEPTSGLDTTVGMLVMETVRRTVRAAGASAIVVTHDLGVVTRFCDRVLVMSAGEVVDDAPIGTFFSSSSDNPYRRSLIEAQTWAIHAEGRGAHGELGR